MSGVIERIAARVVFGWVKTSDLEPADLALVFKGACMPLGVEYSQRPDLAGRGRGFRATLPDHVSARDFGKGDAALRFNGEPLRLLDPSRSAWLLGQSKPAEMQAFLSHLTGGDRQMLRGALTAGQESSANLGCGAISDDEAAIMGRCGHLFLYRGSNDLASLYGAQPSDSLTAEWTLRFDERAAYCAAFGATFLQLVVPEKSSVLHGLVPYACDSATPQWRSLRARTADWDTVVDCGKWLRDSLERHSAYRSADSHLSSTGCAIVTAGVLRSLGLAGDLRASGIRERLILGDLARRFPEVFPDGTELLMLADGLSDAEGTVHLPELVGQADVAGHSGSMRSWTCANAPVRQRVLCFGNSFFERGNHSATLSWWFSRVFSAFEFRWSAAFDPAVVDELRPDIVICQTVERFLGRAPAA